MSTRQLPSIQSCARRAAVLACLRRAGEGAVSGQEIANELGVSRVAVSNHIAALRESGYEIESATRRGYRLLSSPDLPFPFEVYPKIQGRFVQVVGGDVTESTNEDAKALARGGADEGAVVLAARQTRGKGRLGRTWQSPEGGLYASYVLRPSAPPVAVSSLSLVVALGVIDALESFGITGARVKWPNDVLLFDAAMWGRFSNYESVPHYPIIGESGWYDRHQTDLDFIMNREKYVFGEFDMQALRASYAEALDLVVTLSSMP